MSINLPPMLRTTRSLIRMEDNNVAPCHKSSKADGSIEPTAFPRFLSAEHPANHYKRESQEEIADVDPLRS